MQRVKVGIAVDAAHDRLAIDDEVVLPVLPRRLDYPWVALCPVIPAFSDQPYALAVALQAEAITVNFYLVIPFRAGRPAWLCRWSAGRTQIWACTEI